MQKDFLKVSSISLSLHAKNDYKDLIAHFKIPDGGAIHFFFPFYKILI